MAALFIWNNQHVKRISSSILILTCLFFICISSLYGGENPYIPNKVTTVVIDPGHGGVDPGAVGMKSKEKDIVLSIALKLGRYIEENLPDVKVIYTRKTDIFVPLYERADIANKNKADLFISIHANANPKKSIYGSETYVMGENKNESNFDIAKTENSVITLEKNYTTKYEGFDPNSVESYIVFSLMQRTHLNQSLKIAGKVQDQFRERARRTDRGVKQAGFLVLWRTGMPSVLVEAGYISHMEEEKYLNSEKGQDYLASAIYRAFKSYKEEIENSSKFDVTVQEDEPASEQESLSDSTSVIYYKVQLFSSRNKFRMTDPVFDGMTEAKEFNSGKLYKYAVGKYYSYMDAANDLKNVRQKFHDAFIIAVRDTQIIQLNLAKEILNK